MIRRKGDPIPKVELPKDTRIRDVRRHFSGYSTPYEDDPEYWIDYLAGSKAAYEALPRLRETGKPVWPTNREILFGLARAVISRFGMRAAGHMWALSDDAVQVRHAELSEIPGYDPGEVFLDGLPF